MKRTSTDPLARKFMLFCFVMLNAFAFNVCEARNPEMVTGLSVEVLNYAKDPIHFVKLNGEVISGYVDAAKVGEAKGGGFPAAVVLSLPAD